MADQMDHQPIDHEEPAEADTLTHLGDALHAGGELVQARDAWQQARHILDELHHPDAEQVRAKLAVAARAR
jgi:hypothetical protein